MSRIIRTIQKLPAKYQTRYGNRMGLILAVAVVVSLPVPLPGVALGVQGIGEVLRLVGIRF